MIRKILTLAPAFLLALATPWATAQAWPDKAIKLLAPSTAGGPPDVYARAGRSSEQNAGPTRGD